MKKGWTTERIGEIATIKPPKREARERIAADAFVSFLPMEDLDIAIKYPEPKQTKRLSEVVGSYTYFAEGDVLLAKITPCFENGKLGIAKGLTSGIGFGSSEFIVIRPNSTVSNEWLYFFLSRENFRKEGEQRMGGAVGQQRLPKEFVENCEIPIPPLSEQRRIVGVLDAAFAGLARARAAAATNLQNARALFASHLHAVFSQRGKGWVEKRLGEVAEFKNGLNYTRESSGQTLPVVGVGDFQTNSVVPLNQLQTATIDGELSPEYALKCDDILTVRSNGSKDLVGRCMLVPELSETTSYSGFIIRIRVNAAEVLPAFLLHFMKSSDTRERLTRDGGGANISNINQTKLAALLLALPAVAEQRRIVTQLDALAAATQRLAALYERKLAALAALRQALLHQAFAGEL